VAETSLTLDPTEVSSVGQIPFIDSKLNACPLALLLNCCSAQTPLCWEPIIDPTLNASLIWPRTTWTKCTGVEFVRMGTFSSDGAVQVPLGVVYGY